MISMASDSGLHISDRVLGQVSGGAAGANPYPTVVLFAGLHGNEPAGIMAVERVLAALLPLRDRMQGDVLCLAGNLPALADNRRFLWHDLNRLWTRDNVQRARDHSIALAPEWTEMHEQRALLQWIDPILQQPSGPLYFIDLHTTSGPSIPFIALNDQLANRYFARQFPVPAVLGLEEHLEGPMLSYLNETGHVSIAFEAGQHTSENSTDLHVAFIWMALVTAGVLTEGDVPGHAEHRARLAAASRQTEAIYEVIYRHGVSPQDQFLMKPGFENFARVHKGDLLAHDRSGALTADRRCRIFMPLYQPSGSDGYFLVRRIPRWALWASAVLRKINLERILVLLPGVAHSTEHPDTLVVDRRIARFLATELFHLLGYRRKKAEGDKLLFSRREIA